MHSSDKKHSLESEKRRGHLKIGASSVSYKIEDFFQDRAGCPTRLDDGHGAIRVLTLTIEETEERDMPLPRSRHQCSH